MIYFDQAATSYPKPAEVIEAMVKAMQEAGANPGRGAHRMAKQAAKLIHRTREKAAALFGLSDPKKAIFTHNATVGLNQALKGLNWEKGDHIITTSVEHNSVRRPLVYLKETFGVHITYIPWRENKTAFLNELKNAIGKETKLLAMTHASNVTGSVLPLKEALEMAKLHHIITLVDASQTAGHIPIHMKAEKMDMLVFPGHKGLLGPQGTGMLLVGGEMDLTPLHHGGTGTHSELVQQPDTWPEKLESGTLNTPGIAGLLAALELYEGRKQENVSRETFLANKLHSGLLQIENITCFGPALSERQIPIVAFTIGEAYSQEIALILDSHYDIAVRGGLHCSPLTHETLHTMDRGVVRVSLGLSNTEEEVEIFLRAIKEIAMAY